MLESIRIRSFRPRRPIQLPLSHPARHPRHLDIEDHEGPVVLARVDGTSSAPVADLGDTSHVRSSVPSIHSAPVADHRVVLTMEDSFPQRDHAAPPPTNSSWTLGPRPRGRDL